MHNRRIAVLFCAMVAAFVAVDARLFYLQVVRGAEYADYADRQRVALEPRDVARARILTADGRVLAEDRLAFDVVVVVGRLDPSRERRIRRPLRRLFYTPRSQKLLRIRDARWELRPERPHGDATRLVVHARSKLDVEVRGPDGHPMVFEVRRVTSFPLPERVVRAVNRLAEMTGEPRGRLLDRVLLAAFHVARLRTPVFAAVPVVKDVAYDVVAELETHPDEFRGFEIRTRYVRAAPDRALAPHLVGYVSRFNEHDVERARRRYRGWPGRAYLMRLRIGRTGIERSMDPVLRGEFGIECIERDHLNRRQRVLADAPPVAGRDVVLSIDSRLQKIVEEEMAGVVGAAVFLDVKTGRVLALASSPRYDPATFRRPDEYRRLRENPDRPLWDRALRGNLPLGSVFKIVTALAALERGCVPDRVHCAGSIRYGRITFRCHRRWGHGDVRLTEALQYSCNVFFYRTALALGDRALIAMARRLGFGRRTGVRVPRESPGNLPHSARGGELLNLAIGQGRLVVTPLQVAQMVAAVANDGVLVPLKILRELRPFLSDGPAAETPPDPRRRIDLGLSRKSLDAVHLGLYKVVNEVGGTGYRAFRGFDAPFKVCGKTSTAQRRVRRGGEVVRDNVGWFAGYAPHERPRIAFAVAVEHLTGRQGGGSTAAPIARRILEAMPLDLIGMAPAPRDGN